MDPLVSIVATNYNFERFIPVFIESVLKQTYLNWELIVIDDCSADSSFELLKEYERKDSRMKVLRNDRNRHTSYTTNQGIRRALGKYICLISCDDVLLPEKLSSDVSFMEAHSDIGVRYGQLQQIDEFNRAQEYSYLPLTPFSRETLLRAMYLEGNKCVAPGMFIRKSVVEKVGFFHPLLRMTQDYEYHVRLLFRTEPSFNYQPLVQYRRMSDNSNLSSNNSELTVNSEINETFFILENYKRSIQTYEDLRRIFPEVVSFGPKDDRLIPYYLGRIALNSGESHVKAFGLKVLFEFLSQEDDSLYLEGITGFTLKDFMIIMANSRLYESDRYPEEAPSFLRSSLIGRRILLILRNTVKEWKRNGMSGVIHRALYFFGLGGVEEHISTFWFHARRNMFPRKVIFGKKAKIAYVVPGVKISGGVAIILNHVNRLKERGYDVRLLTLSLETDIDWFANTVPVFSVLEGKQLEIDIDVMIATHWSTVSFVNRSDAPRRLYFVQSDERRFNPENKEEVRAIEATYRLDMEYMTEARWIQRWLMEEFGKKAYYVPNGLDQSVFFPSPPIGESKKKIRVLLEGPIDSWFKGMRDAYAAVSGLDCELWIVSSQGKPPSDWEYDRFFECVPIGEMKDVYSSCDIFLKMSYMEGFFGPPMEAMACGCAVVVGKVTGYDEYIVDGVNALVVEQGDIEGAKKAVKRLITDISLREKLIENGKETVRFWSWDQSINLLEKVLAGEKPEKYYSTTQPARYEYQEEMNRLASVRRKVGL